MPSYKQIVGEQYSKLEGSERAKSYFSIVATLVLLIILLLLIFPAIKHITAVNKEISDARSVKASLENKLEALRQANENLNEVESDLPILDLALPVGPDLTTYLKKIEGLAGTTNLKIVAIQFSNVALSKPKLKEAMKPKKLPYSLTLEGAFPDFQKFLIDLESYIRTSDVSVVSLTKGQEGSLKGTLNVTIYYLGTESIPAGTATGKSPEPSAPTGTAAGGAQ